MECPPVMWSGRHEAHTGAGSRSSLRSGEEDAQEWDRNVVRRGRTETPESSVLKAAGAQGRGGWR